MDLSAEPDTINDSMVGVQGDWIVVAILRPVMDKPQALRLAAWLVVLAEETPGEFDALLAAVKST